MVRSGSGAWRGRRRQFDAADDETHLLLADDGDRGVHRVQALRQAVRVHPGLRDDRGGALGLEGPGQVISHRCGRQPSINWSGPMASAVPAGTMAAEARRHRAAQAPEPELVGLCQAARCWTSMPDNLAP